MSDWEALINGTESEKPMYTTTEVQILLREQRQMCADKALDALEAENEQYPHGTYFVVEHACLNATGDGDDS